MNCKKKLLIALHVSFYCLAVFGQSTELHIGDKVPDLEFRQIVNFSKRTGHLSDFADKFVIFDFWASWCKPCVTAFPKNDSLQSEFNNDLQFILITQESVERVQKFYQRLMPTWKFSLPSISDTSNVIEGLFKFKEIPHYVWIDKDRIIRAITGAQEVNKKNIEKFISGKLEVMQIKVDEDAVSLTLSKPLLLDSAWLPKTNLISYSLLSEGIVGARSMSHVPKAGNFANRRIAASRLSMERLFCLAYGNGFDYNIVPSKRVILLTDIDKDVKPKKLFSYDLIIANADSAELYRTMREDLRHKFGYTASFEKRKMNCLVIKQLFPGALKPSISKSSSVNEGNQFYLILKNQPVSELAKSLRLQQGKTDIVDIVDETGFDGNIDLDIKVDLTDLNALNEAIKRYGISLKKEPRLIDILVISKTVQNK